MINNRIKKFQLEIKKILQFKTTDELEIILKQCSIELEQRIVLNKIQKEYF